MITTSEIDNQLRAIVYRQCILKHHIENFEDVVQDMRLYVWEMPDATIIDPLFFRKLKCKTIDKLRSRDYNYSYNRGKQVTNLYFSSLLNGEVPKNMKWLFDDSIDYEESYIDNIALRQLLASVDQILNDSQDPYIKRDLERAKNILLLYYIDGFTQQDISDMLGYSRSLICKILLAVIVAIKEAYGITEPVSVAM